MRHIPEDELHAYLDQGLSRSQCVEIESHLASCPPCQGARDGIAALRDRTTALLSKLAPPRGFPPAFETLQARAAVAASTRRRRVQLGAWAASLVAAIGLGWTASNLVTRPATPSQTPHSTSVPTARPASVTAASLHSSAARQTSRSAPRRVAVGKALRD